VRGKFWFSKCEKECKLFQKRIREKELLDKNVV
jgi:hypothetical protein